MPPDPRPRSKHEVLTSVEALVAAVATWRSLAARKQPSIYGYRGVRMVRFLGEPADPEEKEGERQWRADCDRMAEEERAAGARVSELARSLAEHIASAGGSGTAVRAAVRVASWAADGHDGAALWPDLRADLEAEGLQLGRRPSSRRRRSVEEPTDWPAGLDPDAEFEGSSVHWKEVVARLEHDGRVKTIEQRCRGDDRLGKRTVWAFLHRVNKRLGRIPQSALDAAARQLGAKSGAPRA